VGRTQNEPAALPVTIAQVTLPAILLELPLKLILHSTSDGLKPDPWTETNTGMPPADDGTATLGSMVTVGPPAGEKTFDAVSPCLAVTVTV
jgi:hypothetical protein